MGHVGPWKDHGHLARTVSRSCYSLGDSARAVPVPTPALSCPQVLLQELGLPATLTSAALQFAHCFLRSGAMPYSQDPRIDGRGVHGQEIPSSPLSLEPRALRVVIAASWRERPPWSKRVPFRSNFPFPSVSVSWWTGLQKGKSQCVPSPIGLGLEIPFGRWGWGAEAPRSWNQLNTAQPSVFMGTQQESHGLAFPWWG